MRNFFRHSKPTPWLCAIAALAAVACSPSNAPSPFGSGGGGAGGQLTGGADGSSTPASSGSSSVDPTLGGPCGDDGQCDDGVGCTVDRCDLTVGRCRFLADDSSCQNDVYCDGVERCDLKLGCRAGAPVSCGDSLVCTIDSCDEATHACLYAPRDADGDGDPDVHCSGGHDCDDQDPSVSSKRPEICGNGRDDDCDGQVDEAECASPAHDSCVDPLEIHAPGIYTLNTTAAVFDYAKPCGPAPADSPQAADVVAAVFLPPGPPRDVIVRARAGNSGVGVAIATVCGDPASVVACSAPYPARTGGSVARARGRALGSEDASVVVPVYVTTTDGGVVTLDVQLVDPEPPPTNETCGTATPIAPGGPITVPIYQPTADAGSACRSATGDLFYSFELAAPADVNVYATALDGEAVAILSLRDAACALPEDELTCGTGRVLRKSLPAGTYYVSVAASAPTDVALSVDVSAPTGLLPDESCVGAPPITPNKTIAIDLSTRQDNVNLGCLPGAVDSSHELALSEPSDVLLVQRIAQGDTAALELAAPACAGPEDVLLCRASGSTPIRVARHNLPSGDYRVIAESLGALGVELTAFVRPAAAPVLVPFADACADALVIPSTGGSFQGNTVNANANYSTGCDYGGVTGAGARDQMLSLTLTETKRVVLDSTGTAFTPILDLRQGPSCPGTEMPLGCAIGYSGAAYIDRVLEPGAYFIQIDGYNMDQGAWFLDVYVTDP